VTARHDLVVRNGLLADGRGNDVRRGDVAVDGDRIVAVGRVDGTGRDEIDASGLLVTPGFVDIHTHYDGQVTWETSLRPSSDHGVTTVVMGNCGVGFAPCKPDERELLMRLMEGVEDIPLAVMAAGIPWSWETFPQFLDVLAERSCDVDFATQVPHSAVRVYVMGQRAADREPATERDIGEMRRVVCEAVAAGALGFSTARTLNHRTRAGALAPTVTAAEEELYGIAVGLRELGMGVLQMVDDFHLDGPAGAPEFAMWRRLAEASGRPLSFSLAQTRAAPERWRHLLRLVAEANDAGVRIRGQVTSRPVGSLYGLDLSGHPFDRCASYAPLAAMPLTERVAAMRAPALRATLIAEAPAAFARQPMRAVLRTVEDMYEFGDPPDYAPPVAESLGARAARAGVSVFALAYDALLARDGHAMLYAPGANYADHNLDACFEMMQHRDTVIGLGDGGAHMLRICDASLPSHVLAYWTRDRVGERLPVATAVRMLTADTAGAVGLNDRGVLAPGYQADLNVIDYDRLRLAAPHVQSDLPGGGARLMQRAEGYVATILHGTIVARDGTPTGARPGRLIRGPQERAL